MNPDPACGNCDGVGCMDCRTRVVHDQCVDDCPDCCADNVAEMNEERWAKNYLDIANAVHEALGGRCRDDKDGDHDCSVIAEKLIEMGFGR